MESSTDTTGVLEARLQPWLQEALAGLGGGVRRQDNEAIIGFFNLSCQGVVSIDKLHFCLQQITSLCAAYPRTFVAVCVLPNRAGDMRSSPVKSWT